jgi:hypothetical protein
MSDTWHIIGPTCIALVQWFTAMCLIVVIRMVRWLVRKVPCGTAELRWLNVAVPCGLRLDEVASSGCAVWHRGSVVDHWCGAMWH